MAKDKNKKPDKLQKLREERGAVARRMIEMESAAFRLTEARDEAANMLVNQKQAIRNTAVELNKLDEEIEKELQKQPAEEPHG